VTIPASSGQIAVERLTKAYPGFNAVDDLSFTVEPGRVTGFLGPNGAGKTTTLRMLLGLVAPTSGTATIGGRRYIELERPIEVVGAVLEASSAHRGRTGRNHLRAICLAAGLPMSRADEMLEIVGLEAAGDRLFKGYSLGMRQRLGIATALLGDPQVLILDEPTNGLDPEGIRWMRGLLRERAAEGRTILVSSHLLSEMQSMADDVVILAKGRLVRQGPVAEVTASIATAVHVEVRTPAPAELAKVLNGLGAETTVLPDGMLLVAGVSADRLGDAAYAAGVPLHHLAAGSADLEEAFLQLTHEGAEIR
jgi:ABC-2 type transport system ATP-binding protein